LLHHALVGVLASDLLQQVVVVAPAGHLQDALSVAATVADTRVEVVAGGVDRPASVRAGLVVLRPDVGIVLVHDAARALTPSRLVDAVVHTVRAGHPAVVPGLAVSDTIKAVDARGVVVATPVRESLRAIQTPQGFLREVLEHAHAARHSDVTDDASLVERVGGHVLVIDGDSRALKITSPDDLATAEAMLKQDGYAGA